MSNETLKLMKCGTCHECNLVNRPDIVERIPGLVRRMRDEAEATPSAYTKNLISLWADYLEGK